jgi:ElaB/YqjD/DUF883 family membrane-anchored ribosome-binding protein
MDWKATLADLSAQADDLLRQAEAKCAELKKTADANGDGIPDALEGAMAQARGAADAARTRFAEVQTVLEREADAMPDRLDALTRQAQEALDHARGRVAELKKKSAEHAAASKAPEDPGGPAA